MIANIGNWKFDHQLLLLLYSFQIHNVSMLLPKYNITKLQLAENKVAKVLKLYSRL